MGLGGILLQQHLLVGAIILATIAASEPDPSCVRTCGSLNIPYPFGTREGCYLDPSFLITCNHTFEKPTPFLGHGNITVLNISLDGELRVSTPIARACPNEPDFDDDISTPWLKGIKFPISYTRNKFTGVGCHTIVLIGGSGGRNYATGCVSLCDRIESVPNGSCSGIGCCQTPIPRGIKDFEVELVSVRNSYEEGKFSTCSFGFLVEEKAYKFSSVHLTSLKNKETTLPLVLDWAVGNETCRDAKKNLTSCACKAAHSECNNSTNGPGYRCKCPSGYRGTHTSFMVAKILMSAKKFQTPPATTHAPTFRGVSNVIVPRGTKVMGRKMEKGAFLKSAIPEVSLLNWASA